MKYKITIEPFEITEEQYNAFQDNEQDLKKEEPIGKTPETIRT